MMDLYINLTAVKQAEIQVELFNIFYEDCQEYLENSYLKNSKGFKTFTDFCIQEFIDFDNLLFTD